MRELLLASVNAFNLYDGDETERFARIEALIAGLDADIVAVQEIIARPQEPGTTDPGKRDLAATRVRRLATAIDRYCEVDGDVVFAVGGGVHHAALFWRAGMAPIAGSVRRFERDPAGMWHSFVTCVFAPHGRRMRVGCGQLSPFDPGLGWGWRDAGQVLRAMNGDDTPGLAVADWNGFGTDVDYDPDPYPAAEWHPVFAYQYGPDGTLDRSTAYRLERLGRLRDAARITNSAWAPTTGFHPADPHPPRRIDRWYATHRMPDPAIRSVRVLDHELVGDATDHAPVLLTLDPAQLPE
ncbi:exonuclease/endonuclease/phosphatase family protein [Amycolatopsis panacis]|uniref:Endonuclease/exonuclease/phosphatase family protein n=1 Tax=Amycolatopsis panacis TaxID=2340917 RepID=A0A419IBL1_9PSEU|nr:endonuclease/exonuclease/phosphatase family protein [Amycolatopsis panacis]RJQ92393.1 endonuclease/exonuclease/phosphatase family protein [Amycolatopsis panacis]